ncbi:hypothetical protein JCM10908_005828 [Rhodotorula pacifica]|uniref:uncharacterized protein n=1 Tax=Rhodotorula pacifica TaxID=1495444 RepID=UPI003171FED2
MDLPGPGGQPQRIAIQQQQRPSLSYFLFLSLLIYMMNQNQATQNGDNAFARQQALAAGSDSTSSLARVYRSHRSQLLYREARREGIARWLGVGNTSEEGRDWLQSRYYPDVANGTAPPVTTANATTDNATVPVQEAYRITPFLPQTEGELVPIHRLVSDLFAPRSHSSQSVQDGRAATSPHLYLQNLTGFAKGYWEPLPYTYAHLGLEETWTEEGEEEEETTMRRNSTSATTTDGALQAQIEDDEGTSPSTREGRTDVAQALAEGPALQHIRRQQEEDAANSLLPQNATDHSASSVTFNRTLQRGTFPWSDQWRTSTTSGSNPPLPPRRETRHATFNLRSLQTSATGPILRPRPDDEEEEEEEEEDGHLLRVKEFSATERWQDWEKLGPVVYAGGKLTLHAPARVGSYSGEEEVTELDVEAVHFLDSGRLYGYATPDFARARIVETISLPLMSSTSGSPFSSPNATATAIGHAMLREYDMRLERDVKRLADADELEPPPSPPPPLPPSEGGGSTSPSGDEEVEIVPRCIFTMYGALSPLPGSYTPSQYAEWYSNLFHPTGARVPSPPPSTLSALLASPNCGLVLSIPSAKVHPTQQLWNGATLAGAWLVLIEGTILVLQVRQLERVQGRPGTIANVSHYGVVGMLFVDAYVFVTLLTLGVVFDSRASLSLLAAAFMSLLSSLLFGTRYIAMIREATPDRAVPTPTTATPSPLPAAIGVDGAAEGGGAMAAMPEWARSRLNGWTRRRTRKVLAVTLVGGVALYLVNWYGWTALILWIIYSNWIPQIVLNVWRGTARQSLADEYVIGMTLARIGPPLYFWAYEENCLLVPTTSKIWYLAAYYFAQAAILVLQARLASPQHQRTRLLLRLSNAGAGGARFFIPKKLALWLELPSLSSWDYHPRSLPPAILADLQGAIATASRDLEAGGGGGKSLSSSSDANAAAAATAGEPDCPICLTGVHVFPTKEEEAAGEEDQVRMAFAVTPCAHLVHTECLEQWVMVRSICPVCRASLPPLGG